jgi:hypothetical protein
VSLQHRSRDDKSVGVEQPLGEACGLDVEIAIQQLDGFVEPFLVQADQLRLELRVLPGGFGVLEVLECVERKPGGTFGDDHRSLPAFFEVVEDSVERVGVGGGELLVGGDAVGLDDNDLAILQLSGDFLIDQVERGGDVGTPVFPFRESDGDVLGTRESAGSEEKAGGGIPVRGNSHARREDVTRHPSDRRKHTTRSISSKLNRAVRGCHWWWILAAEGNVAQRPR